MHDTWWIMHSRSPVHLLKMANKNREHCVLADTHHFDRDWQSCQQYCLTSSFISVAMRRQVMWFGGRAAASRCAAARPQCSSSHVLFASLCACRAFQNRWLSLCLIMWKTGGSDIDIQQRWRKTSWPYLSALCNITMKPAVFSTYSPTQTHKHTQAHTSTHKHTHAHTHTRTHEHEPTHTCIPTLWSFFLLSVLLSLLSAENWLEALVCSPSLLECVALDVTLSPIHLAMSRQLSNYPALRALQLSRDSFFRSTTPRDAND